MWALRTELSFSARAEAVDPSHQTLTLRNLHCWEICTLDPDCIGVGAGEGQTQPLGLIAPLIHFYSTGNASPNSICSARI